MEEQINAFCKAQADLALSSVSNSKVEERGSSLFRDEESSLGEIEGLSPVIFAEMEQAVKQKYEMFKAKV